MIPERISVMKGDITTIAVDAIVNAANSSLLGGGGVDGAIHRAGGPAILQECKAIMANLSVGGDDGQRCKTGDAVITTAGNLPAKFVIHTVGPVWNGGKNKEKELLAACYKNSLQLAVDNGCRSIAFPAISTGVYCFPKLEAATIAVKTVREFLALTTIMGKVIFVCFDDENFTLIQQAMGNVSPGSC